MIRAIAGLLICAAVPAIAQPPAARFEVAVIKPSDPGLAPGNYGTTTKPGRLQMSNATLRRCIMGAYRMGPNLIVGGPEWMDSDHFDINAKSEAPGAGDGELMDMLQTLLTDRFKLVLHRETRTLPAYVVETAKNGPRLKKSEGGEANTNFGSRSLKATAMTMDRFAEVLSRQMDLPVVNRTGIEGAFDLTLTWTPLDSKDGGPSIFTAIQEQLGLRLQSQKAPIQVLVIDRAEKPSDN
jgi:uncharacterized protein (TIGR03435 family)